MPVIARDPFSGVGIRPPTDDSAADGRGHAAADAATGAAAILALGSTHPTALSWLAGYWGVTNRLRQVLLRDKSAVGRRLPRDHLVIGCGFFTAGETPHVAVAQLLARWPTLRFWFMPPPAG